MSDVRKAVTKALQEFNQQETAVEPKNKIPNFRLDYDQVLYNINAEYESHKGSHDAEMNAYNSCYNAYAMLPMGNERVGLSQTITPVIYEKVEWIASTQNKIITESDKAYDVQPLGPNNIFTAEVGNQLLNDAIGSGSESYTALTDVPRSSLIAGNAYLKCGWASATPEYPIGHFVFDAVPNERLRWDHDYGTFANSPCVYDTTEESMSDIILMAESDGDWMIDELLEAFKETGSTGNESETDNEALRHTSSSSSHSNNVEKPTESRGMYTVIEGYTNYDVDNDGVSEPVIVVFVNGKLVRFVENNLPGKKHPYIAFQGKRNPHEALGWTIERILGNSQRDATMIDRNIINNISSQDNGIMMYNERNVSPLAAEMHKRGLPRTMLPVGDINNAIAPAPVMPLQPHIPQYRDQILMNADGLAGYVKSQNLDIQMLKGTANNGNIVNSSGQTRIWEDTKRLLETCYKPLAEMCLMYSAEWMTPKDFMNRFGIELEKKEIKELFNKLRFQIKINISLPTDDSDKLQKMMNWAQYFMPMAQPGPDGSMTPEQESLAAAGSKIGFEAAKLMGLSGIERDVNGGEFIGINGLSVTQEDIDIFRASVPGTRFSDQRDAAIFEEELAGAAANELLQEEAMSGGFEEGGAGEGIDELGQLLSAEGSVPGGAGEPQAPIGGFPEGI